MAKPTVESLGRKSDLINRQYSANFAGQSRHTRDLQLLEKLIDKQGKILIKARKLKGKAASDMLATVRERYRLYKKEHALIAEAQTTGLDDALLGEITQQGARAMGLYERNFAGKNRLTRADALLAYLLAELHGCLQRLHALEDVEDTAACDEQARIIEGNIELLKGEQREIARAREDLATDARADLYATLANTYFRLYQVHFASKSRASRHHPLLTHLIGGLRDVASALRDVAPSPSEQQEENATIIASRLAQYDHEETEVAGTQAGLTARQRSAALAADANDISAMYAQHFAGQDRKTRDLDLLGELADRLFFASVEMRAVLSEPSPSATELEKTASAIRKTLDTYHVEFGKIRSAQGTVQGGSRPAAPNTDVRIRPKEDGS